MISDIKQRIWKFDTLHGLYLVPLALWALWDLLYAQENLYIIQSVTFVSYTAIEGIRKIFYNPVKKEALKVVNREQYIAEKLQK